MKDDEEKVLTVTDMNKLEPHQTSPVQTPSSYVAKTESQRTSTFPGGASTRTAVAATWSYRINILHVSKDRIVVGVGGVGAVKLI